MALLTDLKESKNENKDHYLEIDHLKLQALNDSIASTDSTTKVENTKERFWVLFLFGCSTCVNACGWISVAPVFLLVEDVSINNHSKFVGQILDCYIIIFSSYTECLL